LNLLFVKESPNQPRFHDMDGLVLVAVVRVLLLPASEQREFTVSKPLRLETLGIRDAQVSRRRAPPTRSKPFVDAQAGTAARVKTVSGRY